MNKQTWCQTFGKNMVKRKNILRMSLVLQAWNITAQHQHTLYSNTSYYSSFYLQNLGKTAKCSCWLKMLAISDLPVEPPKNCALRDQPEGYEVTQGGSYAKEAGSLEGSLWSCPLLSPLSPSPCDQPCDPFSGSEKGVIFFPLEPKKLEKNNAWSQVTWKEKSIAKHLFRVIMDADEILEEIGSFGFFQKRNAVFLGLIIFVLTFQTVSMVFIGGEPTWRCTANSSVCMQNATISPDDDYYKARCNMSSEDWEFTTEFTSIVTEVRMFYLWNYKVKNENYWIP